MNQINIIQSTYLRNVEKIFLYQNQMIDRTPCVKKDNNWYGVESLKVYDSYCFLINNEFEICDPLTEKYYNFKDIMPVTKTIRNFTDKEILNIKIKAQLCSSIDKENNPIDKVNYFSKSVNPLAIVHLELVSNSSSVVVITVEWIHNKKPFWITAKPFEINKVKKSFNSINITPDLPSGSWCCNIYYGVNLVKCLDFNIFDASGNVTPKSLLIDIRG